jgi:hypothetical protein
LTAPLRAAALLCSLLTLPALAADAERLPFLPLAEVVGGLRGEARTVFAGQRVEVVPLEILGVAPGFAGPGRDVILARLEGDRARQTGVVAGMSGSPVSVDGRLVGALAYRIGSFTREPIAGITPIEQMLAIPEGPEPAQAIPVGLPLRYPLEALVGLAEWPADVPADRGAAAEPLFSTPVAVSGLHPRVQERYAPLLAGQGLGPLTGVVVGAVAASSSGPLQAGDPIAAVLVRGDVTMAGTGTVTLVDGERVLALGHPLARAGRVDFPMARAEVLVTVPSLAGSFKVNRVGEVVGAFHQDRPQGLAGHLGAAARLLPVQVTFEGETRSLGPYSYEIVRAPALTPGLVEIVLANTLMSHDLGAQSGTIHVEGVIEAEGYSPLLVRNSFAGGQSGLPVPFEAARFTAGLFAALYGSPFGAGMDLAIDLKLRLEPEVRRFRIEEVRADRRRAAPGEKVRILVRLRNVVTGDVRQEVFEVVVPPLPRGTRLEFQVGDAASLAAADGTTLLAGIARATSAGHLLRALARLRSADGLYLRVSRPAPGVVLGADALPDLPPSVAAVIAADSSSLGRVPLARTVVNEQQERLPGVVVGAGSLSLITE